MRISIDTDADSFESAIKAVYAAFGFPYIEPVDDSGPDEDDYEEEDDASPQDDYFPGKWNRKRIRRLATYVQEDAAEALRYIAENAPAVDIDEVFEHMEKFTGVSGFNGKHMGGRMSSVGFAQNRIPGTTANIVDTDYRHRKYRMDKDIAKVLLEELAE